MEVKHTTLPWITAGRNGAGDHIHGNDGEVAWCRTYVGINSDTITANAEFIVKACNSHYDLLEALKGAIGALEFSRDYHGDLGNEEQAFAQDKLDAALKAIEKAEGK